MKIIYAEKSTGIKEDGSFQNPKYFERADKNATSVIVYGSYPEIEAAYQDLGVGIEVREAPKPSNPITVNVVTELSPELQQVIDDAKAEVEKVLAENAELKAKIAELEKASAKKPTAAELKAAKAAEANATDQPQE